MILLLIAAELHRARKQDPKKDLTNGVCVHYFQQLIVRTISHNEMRVYTGVLHSIDSLETLIHA